jgi:hypothetical protein
LDRDFTYDSRSLVNESLINLFVSWEAVQSHRASSLLKLIKRRWVYMTIGFIIYSVSILSLFYLDHVIPVDSHTSKSILFPMDYYGLQLLSVDCVGSLLSCPHLRRGKVIGTLVGSLVGLLRFRVLSIVFIWRIIGLASVYSRVHICELSNLAVEIRVRISFIYINWLQLFTPIQVTTATRRQIEVVPRHSAFHTLESVTDLRQWCLSTLNWNLFLFNLKLYDDWFNQLRLLWEMP